MMTVASLSPDRPGEEDELGYAAFAEAVARAIDGLPLDLGFVMAVQGAWGQGKTTAINLTVARLTAIEAAQPEDRRTRVVRFNPWWFSGTENITRAFFQEIGATLSSRGDPSIGKQVKDLGKRFIGKDGVLTPLLSLVPYGDTAQQMWERLGSIVDPEQSLEDERERLAATLREQRRRTLIVIDDLDRLLPDELRQILKLIKSVADLPSLTYLLAYDPREVRRHLGEASAGHGPGFLDKIVQAPFDLPQPSKYRLRGFFQKMLAQVVGGGFLERDLAWPTVYLELVDHLIATPRDAVRLANALRVSWPAVKDEVYLADLVGIEAIRLFEPNLYAAIAEGEQRITDNQALPDKTEFEFSTKIIDSISDKRRPELAGKLKLLFPRLKIGKDDRSGARIQSEWRARRRICSSEHFHSYFWYALDPDTLPSAAVNDLIRQAGDAAQTARTLGALACQMRTDGRSRAEALLDQVADRAGDFALPAIGPFLTVAFEVADDLSAGLPAGSRALRPIENIVQRLVKELLHRFDATERGPFILDVARSTKGLAAFAFTGFSLCAEHGMLVNARSKPDELRLLTTCDAERLRGILTSRLRTAALAEHPSLVTYLWAWAGLTSLDDVRAWTDAQLADDGAVLILATGVVSRWTGFDRNVRIIDPDIEIYLDVERLRARLSDIASAEPDGDASRALRDFDAALERGRGQPADAVRET